MQIVLRSSASFDLAFVHESWGCREIGGLAQLAALPVHFFVLITKSACMIFVVHVHGSCVQDSLFACESETAIIVDQLLLDEVLHPTLAPEIASGCSSLGQQTGN